MAETCRLCGGENTAHFFTGTRRSQSRDFLRCSDCDMVFVPERFLVSEADERERYLTHHNDPHDEGYRRFLSRLVDELAPLLRPGASGLDFGCGPGPALALMLRERGHPMQIYDPFFEPDPGPLQGTYEFITCTETVEHFRRPMDEFQRLNRMLKRPGLLGIMTGMLEDWSQFPEWHYHTDVTHICFYSRDTMEWIAGRFGWECRIPREGVVLFETA